MDFQTQSPCFDLLFKWTNSGAIPFSKKTEIHRKSFCRFQHFLNIPSTRCYSRGISAISRSCATSNHSCDAAKKGVFNLLRSNKMNVGIDAACRGDESCTTMHFGGCANDHIGRNAVHRIGVSCLANAHYSPVFDTNIRFKNARMVNNHCARYHKIQYAFVTHCCSRLCHAISNCFAATKFGFIAINGIVFFNFDD